MSKLSTAELNVLVSRRILDLVAKGAELSTAINVVLGPGTFEKIAGAVYYELKN